MGNNKTSLEVAPKRIHAAIKEANERREQLREAGNLIAEFRAHGDGIYLFGAFKQWHDATSEECDKRRREIRKEMENPAGNSTTDFEAMTSELLAQDVLECLAPVIADVLDFCEAVPKKSSEQLTALRDALRIGKFHAPSDSALEDKKRKCVSDWIMNFGKLEGSADYKTSNAIAKDVARKHNINPKTAKNYWEEFLEKEPWQKQWLLDLIGRVQSRKNRNKKQSKQRSTKAIKPKSWRN